MRYDVKNLNIWKEGSRRGSTLAASVTRTIPGYGDLVKVYMGRQLLDMDIDDLSLSVRARNCLKRAGLNCVGDVIGSIETWDDLLKIKNLGANSAGEIKRQIVYCQDMLLAGEKKGGLREWLD